mmetsp:Transcript_9585/g.9538  ORF Transcript_9585/g.9538 Transcript_9585/m.9538 type:complete len:296 (+) Transcript_9585:40-927(+)
MGNTQVKFNPRKLHSSLKMSSIRIGILKNKIIGKNSQLRDEIAGFLRSSQEEMAMIKVEGYINNENLLMALEVINLFCLQCCERIQQFRGAKECPTDIRTAVESIIYAANRVDCKELIEARQQFTGKFGVEFSKKANFDENHLVNKMIVEKLTVTVPCEELKLVKIQEIAVAKKVDYVTKDQAKNMMKFNNYQYVPNAPDLNSRPSSQQTDRSYSGQKPNGNSNQFPSPKSNGGFNQFPSPKPNGGSNQPSSPKPNGDSNQFPSPPTGFPGQGNYPSFKGSNYLDSIEDRFRNLK